MNCKLIARAKKIHVGDQFVRFSRASQSLPSWTMNTSFFIGTRNGPQSSSAPFYLYPSSFSIEWNVDVILQRRSCRGTCISFMASDAPTSGRAPPRSALGQLGLPCAGRRRRHRRRNVPNCLEGQSPTRKSNCRGLFTKHAESSIVLLSLLCVLCVFFYFPYSVYLISNSD